MLAKERQAAGAASSPTPPWDISAVLLGCPLPPALLALVALTTSPVFSGCPTSLTYFGLFCFFLQDLILLHVDVLPLETLTYYLSFTGASCFPHIFQLFLLLFLHVKLFFFLQGNILQLHHSNPSPPQHLITRCCDEGPCSLFSTISLLLHWHFITLPLPPRIAHRVSVPLLIVETLHT